MDEQRPTQAELDRDKKDRQTVEQMLASVGTGMKIALKRIRPGWDKGYLETCDADPDHPIDLDYIRDTHGGETIEIRILDHRGRYIGGSQVDISGPPLSFGRPKKHPSDVAFEREQKQRQAEAQLLVQSAPAASNSNDTILEKFLDQVSASKAESIGLLREALEHKNQIVPSERGGLGDLRTMFREFKQFQKEFGGEGGGDGDDSMGSALESFMEMMMKREERKDKQADREHRDRGHRGDRGQRRRRQEGPPRGRHPDIHAVPDEQSRPNPPRQDQRSDPPNAQQDRHPDPPDDQGDEDARDRLADVLADMSAEDAAYVAGSAFSRMSEEDQRVVFARLMGGELPDDAFDGDDDDDPIDMAGDGETKEADGNQ